MDTPVESILSSVISKETQLIKDVESLMNAVGKDGNITSCLQKVIDGLSNFIEIYRKVPQKCFKNFHKCLKYIQRHKKISVKTSMSYKIGNLYFQYEKPGYGMKHHSKVIEDILKNPKKNVALDLEKYILTMNRFGKVQEAYQEIQALYRTNDDHAYNLAICLNELGQLDNALSYIAPTNYVEQMDLVMSLSKTQENSGFVSKALRMQKTIDILIRKKDYKNADKYSEIYIGLFDQDSDSDVILGYLTCLFKVGQCAFETKDYSKAYDVFQGYIKKLMTICVDVKYNVSLIREAILRIPKIFTMLNKCISVMKNQVENGTKKGSPERLKSWRGILRDVDFDLKNDLLMDGLLKALMYQSVVCSCMYPGAIINAEAYHHLIFELYQKLGWYEEAVKYSEFDLNLKPSLTESFLQTIESRYRIIDVFLHMGYIHEAIEICEFILKLLRKKIFVNVGEIEDLQKEGQLRLFIIYYKYQKNYKKAEEIMGDFTVRHVTRDISCLKCLACLNEWEYIIQNTEKLFSTKALKDIRTKETIDSVQLLPTGVQEFQLLRGWCYKNMKLYSEATESFNLVIENSTTPFAVFLQKIHTAFLRGHNKPLRKVLIKLFNECSTMKKLIKLLLKTLEDYPYFKEEWIQILNIISRYGRELMPYPKSEIQGFKLYRSSSFMSMHFEKIRCSEFE